MRPSGGKWLRSQREDKCRTNSLHSMDAFSPWILPILGMVLETENLDTGPLQRGREASRAFGSPMGVERQKSEFWCCQGSRVLMGQGRSGDGDTEKWAYHMEGFPLKAFAVKSKKLKGSKPLQSQVEIQQSYSEKKNITTRDCQGEAECSKHLGFSVRLTGEVHPQNGNKPEEDGALPTLLINNKQNQLSL